jgi:hypothetical protein
MTVHGEGKSGLGGQTLTLREPIIHLTIGSTILVNNEARGKMDDRFIGFRDVSDPKTQSAGLHSSLGSVEHDNRSIRKEYTKHIREDIQTHIRTHILTHIPSPYRPATSPYIPLDLPGRPSARPGLEKAGAKFRPKTSKSH